MNPFIKIYDYFVEQCGEDFSFKNVANASARHEEHDELVDHVAEMILLFGSCHVNHGKMRQTLQVIWQNHYEE